jgi:membrane protein YdbS with pleckstrin-like domain
MSMQHVGAAEPAWIPADPAAVLERAKALLRRGDAAESESMFRQLLALPSHAAVGLYGVGVARLAVGDLAAARSFFERALDRDPTNANALYQLGFVAEKGGAKEEAVAYYERALALVPGHISARERLRSLSSSRKETPAVVLPSGQAPAAAMPSSVAVGGSAIYDYLRQDASPLSRQTVAAVDQLQMRVHPSISAYAGKRLATFAVVFGVPLIAGLLLASAWLGGKLHALATTSVVRRLHLHVSFDVSAWAKIAIVATLLVAAVTALIALMRVRATTIAIDRGRLQIRKGLFARRLINIDLWRVHSIELERTFFNRLTGDGTLVLELIQQRATREGDTGIELVGIARGKRLEEVYQQLLNVVFLLRGNPLVKGIIQ